MLKHSELDQSLRRLIRNHEIRFGGNSKLKTYGTLHCKSGKRMKKENRVFFKDEAEARQVGYKPCGHCMKGKSDSRF